MRGLPPRQSRLAVRKRGLPPRNFAIRDAANVLSETFPAVPCRNDGSKDEKNNVRGRALSWGETAGGLGVEQANFDWFIWLLRVDDDRLGGLNVHQLISDLLFRFQ